MLCEHVIVCPAGYYTHISTLADVQENVMEYLHVLSRPMVINHDHDIIWTEAYMDSVVSWLLSSLVCLLGCTHLEDLIKLSEDTCAFTFGCDPMYSFYSLEGNLCLSPWY